MFPVTTQAGGVHTTAGPLDVCKTPTPAGPQPIPYPNIAYANRVDGLAASGDEAAKRVKVKLIKDQQVKGRNPSSATQAAILSKGDEAGTTGGVVTHKTRGPAFYVNAPGVKFEGAPVVRMLDITSQSDSSANLPGTVIQPSQTKVIIMGN